MTFKIVCKAFILAFFILLFNFIKQACLTLLNVVQNSFFNSTRQILK